MTDESPPKSILQLGPFDRHGTTRASYGGRSIEVEHGIPGEVVEAEIAGGKRQRGHIVRVVKANADRVVPPCVYFREWACGGCQWQQIAYRGQIERKSRHVEAVMAASGLQQRVIQTHALEDPWNYRSTAGISLGRNAGFRRHGSLAIVPINACPISHPRIGQLMAALNEHIHGGTLPDFRGRVRLEVRVAGLEGEDRLQVLVRPTEEGKRPAAADIDRLVHVLCGLEPVSGVATMGSAGEIEIHSGQLLAPAMVAGHPVYLAAATFFQTNLRLLPRLIERIREEVSPRMGVSVADVYGGVGVFGLFLALDGAEVTVIESDPLAVRAGETTAREWGLSSICFQSQRAEEALGAGPPYDVIIVDPPRSGLSRTVIETLMRVRPPLLLYVSCLPESLARDLAPLTAVGYRVDALELFDFYPQTYHEEVLAVLRYDST